MSITINDMSLFAVTNKGLSPFAVTFTDMSLFAVTTKDMYFHCHCRLVSYLSYLKTSIRDSTVCETRQINVRQLTPVLPDLYSSDKQAHTETQPNTEAIYTPSLSMCTDSQSVPSWLLLCSHFTIHLLSCASCLVKDSCDCC